jgi:hypothetical protein
MWEVIEMKMIETKPNSGKSKTSEVIAIKDSFLRVLLQENECILF